MPVTPSQPSTDASAATAADIVLVEMLAGSAAVLVAIRSPSGTFSYANAGFAALLDAVHDERGPTPPVAPAAMELFAALDREVERTRQSMRTVDEVVAGDRVVRLASVRFPLVGEAGSLRGIALVAIELPDGALAGDPGADAANPSPTIEQLERTIERLRSYTATDPLTGCWTRARLEESGHLELLEAGRYRHPASIAFVDLDHFKRINDEFGHLVGDAVLRRFAEAVKSCLRATDLMARWGGDEFLLVLPNTGSAGARLLAERIRAEIEGSELSSYGCVTASLGVAECGHDDSWESWVARADAAMYEAKRLGRNRVVVARSIDPKPRGAGSLLHLAWHPDYECGNAVIDHEHRRLVQAAGELLNVVIARDRALALELLQGLLAECDAHFRHEEAILRDAFYRGLEGHAATHADLSARASRLLEQCRAGELDAGELFAFIARDVVAGHLLGEDRQYFEFLDRARRRARRGARRPS